jgi:hypothetical protein
MQKGCIRVAPGWLSKLGQLSSNDNRVQELIALCAWAHKLLATSW